MSLPTENELRLLATELSSPVSDGYLQRPLPCDLDERTNSLVEVFVKGSQTDRQRLVEVFGQEQAFSLLTFAERMAILGVRKGSRELLLNGLLALVIEGFRLDARENLLVLSLLNRSAQKIGLDPKVLFEDAARCATPDVAKYLRDFSVRSPQDRSIQAMGYREEMTPDGFTYIREW